MQRLFPLLIVLSLLTTGCGGNSATSGSSESSTDAPKSDSNNAKKDIVDTAVAAGDFNTLVTAVKEAMLVEALKGDGPLTVFAPTDAAFAKIPEDQLKAVLADKELLKSILTYHVVEGKVMAADVVKLTSAETLQGKKVAIKVDGETVMVGNAKVVKTDIECSNGVIHVIDTVLMPPKE